MRQIVLDTETTGLECEQGHRIIEIGCVELVNRDLGKKFHRLVNPQRESEAGALKVHGISSEKLKDQPLFNEIWGELYEFVKGAELLIHHAPFDIPFFDAELKRMGRGSFLGETGCTVCDTLELAHALHPGARNKLDALSDRYGIDRSQRADYHGALIDAELLARVYLAMTSGQATISFAPERVADDTNIEINIDGEGLPVIRADADECRKHDNFMKQIAK